MSRKLNNTTKIGSQHSAIAFTLGLSEAFNVIYKMPPHFFHQFLSKSPHGRPFSTICYNFEDFTVGISMNPNSIRKVGTDAPFT